MDELIARLEKLLWCCNVLANQRPAAKGKPNAEAWSYHAETVLEAIVTLREEAKCKRVPAAPAARP